MTQYLVAIHLPDDFDPSVQDKSMERDIDALNEEMEAKGVRLFAGGLRPASEAKSLRIQPDHKVLITDGPYLETKEHVGGFWILEVADMDEALAWARKAVVACRAPVEVRSFFRSDPTGLQADRVAALIAEGDDVLVEGAAVVAEDVAGVERVCADGGTTTAAGRPQMVQPQIGRAHV